MRSLTKTQFFFQSVENHCIIDKDLLFRRSFWRWRPHSSVEISLGFLIICIVGLACVSFFVYRFNQASKERTWINLDAFITESLQRSLSFHFGWQVLREPVDSLFSPRNAKLFFKPIHLSGFYNVCVTVWNYAHLNQNFLSPRGLKFEVVLYKS